MKNVKKASDNQKKAIAFQEQHKEKHRRMQQQMSFGALIILVVVVVAFVAWPILSNGMSSGVNVSFGSYRGEPVNYTSRYGLFNNNLNNLLNQFGVDSSSNDFQRRSVFERAFFSTVSQYGNYFYLLDRGNDVSRKESNSLIYQQFNKDGKLDRAAWNQLQNDPNRLKNVQNIMTYAAAQNIWDDVYNSMDMIDDKELELLIPTLGDVRKVSYLYYKVSDYPEAEVEKFYDKNDKLFQKEFLRRIVTNSEADRKEVEEQLNSGSGNFGELAQLYSSDVYSQSKGEYGYKFYYELLNSFNANESINEEQAAEWADSIYNLKRGEFTGPFEMGEQWYFFQIKTKEEIEADKKAKEAEQGPKEEGAGQDAADSAEEATEELTGFAAVASVVRTYIERNEISLITDYFRKNLESLKAKAQAEFQSGTLDSLAYLDQGDRDVVASYALTPQFFGFSYGPEPDSGLYDPVDKAFPESALAKSIGTSKVFFEDIFSLEKGELSDVMLFGTENPGSQADEQYVAFFRLEDARKSNVNDFGRNPGDGLDSKKTTFNYYLNNLVISGTSLEFLSNRNLKQRFESAYSSWSSSVSQN